MSECEKQRYIYLKRGRMFLSLISLQGIDKSGIEKLAIFFGAGGMAPPSTWDIIDRD
jgi:hypothetical protein